MQLWCSGVPSDIPHAYMFDSSWVCTARFCLPEGGCKTAVGMSYLSARPSLPAHLGGYCRQVVPVSTSPATMLLHNAKVNDFTEGSTTCSHTAGGVEVH